MTLESHVNEVLRKIGRNILLFQEFEYLLKHIVAKGSFSGFMSEIGSNIEKRTILIQKQTMGQLVGQYLETTDPEYQDSSNVPEELKEPFFLLSFKLNVTIFILKPKKMHWLKWFPIETSWFIICFRYLIQNLWIAAYK